MTIDGVSHNVSNRLSCNVTVWNCAAVARFEIDVAPTACVSHAGHGDDRHTALAQRAVPFGRGEKGQRPGISKRHT